MRNGDKHMERKWYKTDGVRVGLSEIKELSKSSVKTAHAITVSPKLPPLLTPSCLSLVNVANTKAIPLLLFPFLVVFALVLRK